MQWLQWTYTGYSGCMNLDCRGSRGEMEVLAVMSLVREVAGAGQD